MVAISGEARNVLFDEGRTYNKWTDRPVDEDLLRELYRLTALCPTSANSSPARFIFVTSAENKAALAECAADANKPKILAAPVTVIVASDTRFFEEFPKLQPARPELGERFGKVPALAEETAFRNSSMQAAYLILAARSLGLDTGPMSGFDRAAVEAAFFPDGRFTCNLLCCVGYGSREGQAPRLPRLSFDEAARFI